MKKAIIPFFCTMLLLSFVFNTNAQEVVISSGGEGSGVGGSVSYTAGQVVYNINSGSSGTVSEGVQQPFEISIATGVENNSIELSIDIYPNPVKNHLTIKIKDDSWMDRQTILYLYDINGMLLKQSFVVANETMIDMDNLKPTVYVLKVVQNGKEAKEFKIVKN